MRVKGFTLYFLNFFIVYIFSNDSVTSPYESGSDTKESFIL